jgi:hypothetical protein
VILAIFQSAFILTIYVINAKQAPKMLTGV